MANFTLRPKVTRKPSRGCLVLLDGKIVGHMGVMASGAVFVNAASVHPTLAFVSHATTMPEALAILLDEANKLCHTP